MATRSKREDPQDGGAPTRDEWRWKPAMGEGSATALDTLHRAERVKRTWRELKKPAPSEGEGPSSE